MSEMIVPPGAQAAWQNYLKGLEEIRELLYSQPWGRRPEALAAANAFFYEMQTAAFNLIIGPRQDYPIPHITFEPNLIMYGTPAADFKYRKVLLDGARTYRLFGKRNSSLFVDSQVISNVFGSPGGRLVGHYDLDNFVKSDGTFDIVVSATPHEGAWMALDPASPRNMLHVREAFLDWEAQAAEMHLELAEGERFSPPLLSEEEFGDRLEAAIRYIKFVAIKWEITSNNNILESVGTNAFYNEPFKENAGAANNVLAAYPSLLYDIKDDEALIIECEIPEQIQYWSVQLGDIWHRAVDFTYHQASLNSHYATLDADGRFRAVVSLTDPGVANWLDPVGIHYGYLILRLYRFNRQVKPTAKKVPLKSVLDHLPKGTKMVGAEERKSLLAARTRAIRARYGY